MHGIQILCNSGTQTYFADTVSKYVAQNEVSFQCGIKGMCGICATLFLHALVSDTPVPIRSLRDERNKHAKSHLPLTHTARCEVECNYRCWRFSWYGVAALQHIPIHLESSSEVPSFKALAPIDCSASLLRSILWSDFAKQFYCFSVQLFNVPRVLTVGRMWCNNLCSALIASLHTNTLLVNSVGFNH